jgi:hypothetical protein
MSKQKKPSDENRDTKWKKKYHRTGRDSQGCMRNIMDAVRMTLRRYFEEVADPELEKKLKELYQGFDGRNPGRFTPAYVCASLDVSAHHGEDPHTAMARLVVLLHDELARRIDEQIEAAVKSPVAYMKVPFRI